jgi:hypothetical protein
MFNAASMMSMFTPTLKSGDTIINKLKAAKSIEPGDLSGLSDKMLGGGGLSSFFKTPGGSGGSGGGSGGAAKGAAQGAAGQSNTVPPLNNAAATSLATLASDVEALNAQARELLGLGSDSDGFLITLGLTEIADALGTNHPYSSAVLLKPLNAEAELNTVIEQSWRIANDLAVKRSITTAQAGSQAAALSTMITDITSASVAARTTLMALAAQIKSVSAASAMLESGSDPWKSAMETFIRDEVKTVMRASNYDLIKEAFE